MRLQHAKEREKALKAQLNAQRERLHLETQEWENQHLELDLIQGEQERVAQDKEQEQVELLQAEKAKLLEVVRKQEHRFELEKERVRAEFNERRLKLQHDLNLREMEVEQQQSEIDLQKRLEEANLRKAQLEHTNLAKKIPDSSRNPQIDT